MPKTVLWIVWWELDLFQGCGLVLYKDRVVYLLLMWKLAYVVFCCLCSLVMRGQKKRESPLFIFIVGLSAFQEVGRS